MGTGSLARDRSQQRGCRVCERRQFIMVAGMPTTFFIHQRLPP